MWNVRNVRHNSCLFLSFDEILMTIVIERCSRIHSIRHSTNQHQYLPQKPPDYGHFGLNSPLYFITCFLLKIEQQVSDSHFTYLEAHFVVLISLSLLKGHLCLAYNRNYCYEFSRWHNHNFGVYYSNFKGKVKQFSALVVNHFTQFDFYAIQKWATSSIVILGRNE